ncbi:MAG: hypothetical protein KatS3mg061_3495 [Dehalococcoidia bacterium]|nr:MAG: hypothetical protein KatS3mg061_3495 [Dehalococcoidia bacterium]
MAVRLAQLAVAALGQQLQRRAARSRSTPRPSASSRQPLRRRLHLLRGAGRPRISSSARACSVVRIVARAMHCSRRLRELRFERLGLGCCLTGQVLEPVGSDRRVLGHDHGLPEADGGGRRRRPAGPGAALPGRVLSQERCPSVSRSAAGCARSAVDPGLRLRCGGRCLGRGSSNRRSSMAARCSIAACCTSARSCSRSAGVAASSTQMTMYWAKYSTRSRLARGDVEQQAQAARGALDEPDMADRRGQLDMAHPLAPHLGACHLDPALIADDALVSGPACTCRSSTRSPWSARRSSRRRARPSRA